MEFTEKDVAKEIIRVYGNDTAYFDGSMTKDKMYQMLRYRMNFGLAETYCIIAALILAGAKFKEEDEKI